MYSKAENVWNVDMMKGNHINANIHIYSTQSGVVPGVINCECRLLLNDKFMSSYNYYVNHLIHRVHRDTVDTKQVTSGHLLIHLSHSILWISFVFDMKR